MRLDTALTRVQRGLAALVLAATAVFFLPGELLGQGVTTAAVRGTVVDQNGAPIVGATVTMVNAASGLRFAGQTVEGGRFFIANVIAGAYSVEARAIGYRPSRRSGLAVSLGQVAEVDLRLEGAAVELTAIEVQAAPENALLSPGRTGQVSYVTEELIRSLPSLNRNFTDFIQTVPGVVGTSIGGQNNRFNNIQIDGGVNNDLFGLAASGTPGGQANARPISVEAVREFQVLLAPFDVRQGGFTGGLVNAITRTGTNEFRGSVFGYHQNEGLVGNDTAGNPAADFTLSQYGFTLGGPIQRDRIHFFGVVDLSRRSTPFAGITIGSDTTGGADSAGVGIRRATAERVAQIARDSLGFDPGDFRAPTIKNPDTNFFFKLTAQLGAASQLELSWNRVDASDYNLIRAPTATGFRDGYQLSNSGYNFESVTNTLRARLNTPLGSRLTNELLLSYTTVRDQRALPNRRPLIFVGGDRAGTNIAIGADRFSHANRLDQDIVEITDNLTINMGRHTLILGTHNELFGFYNVFFPASLGVWSFRNADSLAAGNPNRYEIALPGPQRPDGPVANFDVTQYGLYVMDQWQPNPRLTLTFGLRADFPNMDAPAYNITLDTAVDVSTSRPLGVRTDTEPTSQILWSPRIGFNYDARGDGSFYIRGGVGVFSGRPPYVWTSNAYANTGLEQVSLVCTGTNVPAFTADVNAQPTTCGTGAVAPIPSVVFYDPEFRFPQTMRATVGFDRQLPWGVVGTFDAVYTRTLNSYYIEDVNLRAGGHSMGEGGRQLYGTLSTSSSSTTPRRRTARARDVLLHRNENQDYSISITGQLNKRFSNGLEFNASYTWSRTMDLMSMTSSIASSNFRFATLDGTLEDRNLRRSAFDIPHQVKVSGTAQLPYRFQFSLYYVGRSGSPYAYVVSNDANGDSWGGNDLVYVPANASDISLNNPAQWPLLDEYIQSEPCLREQRGRIMERNSCRNPWQSFVNARVTKSIPTLRGHDLELHADIFNLLSFLGVGGRVRETSQFEGQNLLSVARYSTGLSRPIYNLQLPTRERLSVNASRWRLQLGARYSF